MAPLKSCFKDPICPDIRHQIEDSATGTGDVSVYGEPIHRAQDIALIIDSSGSMRRNDPGNIRLTAARLFLEAMHEEDFATVIDFDTWWRVAHSLAGLKWEKSSLKQAVSRINSLGGTNVGLGLEAAYNELLKAPFDNTKAALLLTDGRGRYANQAQRFAQKGWPVYTIGLSHAADTALLQKIAAETGGRYYFLEDPEGLINVYLEIYNLAFAGTAVAMWKEPMQTGETRQIPVTVPSDQISSQFLVTWPGSTVGVTLVTPNGQTITPQTAQADPHISYLSGPTYVFYQINEPAAGEWQVNLEGIDLAEGGEPVTVQVSARGDKPVQVTEQIYLPSVTR